MFCLRVSRWGDAVKSAEQIAQHIADDFMLDLDGRVALSHAIKDALTAFSDEQNRNLLASLHLETQLEDAIRRNARDQAIEEAAKVTENTLSAFPFEIAKEIRALKGKAVGK